MGVHQFYKEPGNSFATNGSLKLGCCEFDGLPQLFVSKSNFTILHFHFVWAGSLFAEWPNQLNAKRKCRKTFDNGIAFNFLLFSFLFNSNSFFFKFSLSCLCWRLCSHQVLMCPVCQSNVYGITFQLSWLVKRPFSTSTLFLSTWPSRQTRARRNGLKTGVQGG